MSETEDEWLEDYHSDVSFTSTLYRLCYMPEPQLQLQRPSIIHADVTMTELPMLPMLLFAQVGNALPLLALLLLLQIPHVFPL